MFVVLMMVPGLSRAAKGILGMNPTDPVAIVNGEEIPVIEMMTILQQMHGGMEQGSKDQKKAQKIDYSEILDRLINVRLIIQEARNIGFHELPDFKKSMDTFRDRTLISTFLSEKMKDIKIDQKEVQKQYEGSAVEWKMTSYLFKDKEDAISLVKEVREGKPLEETAERYISEEKATKGDADIYMKKQDLLPEILELVTRMPMGEVSPVVQIEAGFVVLRLDDKRTYDEASIRGKIEEEVRSAQKKEETEKVYKELKEKYVSIDEDLFEGLKFGSNEDFEKALNDERVVATVQGEAPITVGEITSEIQTKFFHGLENEKALKRASDEKYDVLDLLLHKRVFLKEALATGIDKTDYFKFAVKEHENSLLFRAFLQRVVVPDIKLKDEEIKAYYDEHLQDYTYPEMMKIHSIVFAERAGAEKAMELLHKGTDFKWIRENSEGQISEESEGLMRFDGKILITENLPAGMREAVSGAQAGSYRLFESPEHDFYVLYIEAVNPAEPRPLDEVREAISKQMFNRKIGESVEKWAKDLREASNIKILIDIEK